MHSLKSLRALKLIVNAKPSGRVVQGCLSDDLKRLEGIWVDSGLNGLRFIDADHISVIGSHAIIADEQGIRLRIRPCELFIRAVSTQGTRLGAIVDAHINDTTLLVDSLVMTEGYWDALMHARRLVANFHYDRNQKMVIVPENQLNQEVSL